jgi:hypothetical protein
MAELHDPHGSVDETPTAEPANGSASASANDSANDSEGTPKPDGLGENGTIPNDPNGIAAGHTGTASSFEPEEDEHAE